MFFYRPNYLMMSAGPTNVAGNTLQARSKNFGNPDLDDDFFKFYDYLCYKFKQVFGTEKSQVIIMNGEGMLGLDAACASLTEKDDKVLVISNGVFGAGFKELVEIYGGNVTLFESSWKESINLKELEKFLNNNSNFKFATLVHCDTPSGILNDIAPVCKLLKSKGILTVVDTVAAIGGVEFNMDEWGVDVALAASQKVFSAAPGLTIMAISDDAWKAIENRSTPIPSFYCNLSLWKNCVENRLFPYTMPASDIISLNTALDNLLSGTLIGSFYRHIEMRDLCLKELKDMGCELYLNKDFSPTVTAFIPPKGINASSLLETMKKNFNILLSGSYGPLKDSVVRIGHMGENAREDRVRFTLDCLRKAIERLRK